MSKNKEVSTKVSAEVMQQLKDSFPSEPSALRITLPRISMTSQDKFEGKGKAMKVTEEAGTFFIEFQSNEINEETGKKDWIKDELGKSFEGIILFQRKQLRYYDEATEMYTSSPTYDTDEEIVPLFCDKKEIKRGKPADLKKDYEYTDKEGKLKSKLEDNRILYVLYNGEPYQINLRGSSMWSFKSYAKKLIPNTVLTKFSSEAQEKGSIAWNRMSFTVVRALDADEATDVLQRCQDIKKAIMAEKASYAATQTASKKLDDEFDDMVESAQKKLEK